LDAISSSSKIPKFYQIVEGKKAKGGERTTLSGLSEEMKEREESIHPPF
jgi:hypothetical protein